MTVPELSEAMAARLPQSVSARPPRVVAVGGGTGLPSVLAGLAGALGRGDSPFPVDVTAVVTTTDDGGSSGELRRIYGIPSPGDIRNCLVALAAGLNPLAAVFQHRFAGVGGLGGHTVGNVVITALTQSLGDFRAAVRAAGDLLSVRGRVLPATDRCVELVATLDDGRIIRGESAITAAQGHVGRLALERPVPALPEALDAIAGADLVVLGPGSLYSSIIATLLVDGMAEALDACTGARVLVVNLFTQPGETDGYSAADHVRAVERHVGPVVDAALVHGPELPERIVATYAAGGSRPVAVDRAALARLGVVTVAADLLAAGDAARHDPAKLARVLLDLTQAR
jgi:uncharacterized cofD-like protein